MPWNPRKEKASEKRRVSAAHLIGMAALSFSALYFLSDVIDALQGGFSVPQLLLTLVAEAAIPVVVIGLYAVQPPRIGRLGLVSALAYAYAFVFFTGTVVYALINGTNDYSALSDDLGALMTAHGAIMVFAGIGFGVALIRARVLPAWTGVALGAGVILVAATQSAPEGAQLVAAAIRDLAFAGMGLALLAAPSQARQFRTKTFFTSSQHRAIGSGLK
jgi:hypothetical protein